MIGTVILPGALSLSAKAYDLPTGTTHISSDTIRQWIGDTVQAQYLGADGEYHATTATYQAIQYIAGANISGLTASDYNGRSVLWYTVPYPSDAMTAYSFSPVAIIQPQIHLSNVKYVDFGFAFHMSNKFLNVSFSTAQPYGYIDYYFGGASRMYAGEGASGSLVGHLGSYQIVGSNYYGGNIRQLEGTATDFYLSDISAVCGGTYNGQLLLGVGVLDMIVNEDYVLEENAPPPSGGGGDTPSGSASGRVTGTIGEQDVNVDVDITQVYPDWMYSAEVTDYDDGGFEESVTSLGTVDVEGMSSGVSALGTYDSGILWYALEQLFGQHTEIVLLLSGCGALCLFGFVLNRFGR